MYGNLINYDDLKEVRFIYMHDLDIFLLNKDNLLSAKYQPVWFYNDILFSYN